MKTQKRIEWCAIILCLVLGTICLFLPKELAADLPYYAGGAAAISGLYFLVDGLFRKHGVDLVAAACLFVLAVICFLARRHGNYLLAAAFAIYFVSCGVVLFIQCGLDLKKKGKDWIAELVMGLLFCALGIMSLVLVKTDIFVVQWILGGYLYLQALQMVFELHYFSTRYNAAYYSFRNWLCLPAFIVGILPSIIYMIMVNSKMRKQPDRFDYHKNEDPVDLSVFIHTGTYASKLYGHMTFSRNGVAYSYGDYDYNAEKFFHLIGPGTFFTVGSDVYSNNCSIVENSPQFEYGIHLTDEQKQAFDDMVQQVLDQTEPWQCQIEQMEPEEAQKAFPSLEHLYADRLWWRTGCQFRQYHSGDWAWYSLLGNNCSNFAAAKLNEIGLHIPVAKGVVSPGEFFQFFEEALQDPDSPVVSRSWHSAAVPETLFDTID